MGVLKVAACDSLLVVPPVCTAVAVTLYCVLAVRLLSWQKVWVGLAATGEQVTFEQTPVATVHTRRRYESQGPPLAGGVTSTMPVFGSRPWADTLGALRKEEQRTYLGTSPLMLSTVTHASPERPR